MELGIPFYYDVLSRQWDKINSYPVLNYGMGLTGVTLKPAKDKVCPLNVVAALGYYYGECLKEKCEWYLQESDQCSIPVIARKIQKL